MKTALCFRYAQTLLQVGQADLLRGSFLSDAIYEACAAKAILHSLRSCFFEKQKHRCVARRHSLNTVVCEQKRAKAKA